MNSLRIILVSGFIVLTGCPISYPCDQAATQLVNPDTGLCEWVTLGDGSCGRGVPEPALSLEWPSCYSWCADLSESACQATPGCHAGFVDGGYFVCWEVVQPRQPDVGCETLDSYGCAAADDCVSNYIDYRFASCSTEKTLCSSDLDCQSGETCSGADICLSNPNCTGGDTCTAECWGYCEVQNTPPAGSCHDEPLCDSLPPQCPAGTVAGVLNGCWSGYCIPFASCDPPIDPGLCYEPVICTVMPPACPPGSTPGSLGGCWSGYCIPNGDCEPPPACADIVDEVTCVNRTDCEPLYRGVGCSCDQNNNCTCQDWVFDGCSNAP